MSKDSIIDGIVEAQQRLYLRNHPGMEVDITTAEGAGDTLCREIHLRKAEP